MVRTASLALLAAAMLFGSGSAWGASPIQVLEGATPLPERSAPLSFGTAEVASVKTRIFTLRNTGTTAINLDPLMQVPAGFTIARRPGVDTLAPGASTTIGVSLNSARAGYFTGNVVVNTSAGAVSFPIDGAALGTPSVRILDNADAGFRAIGRWMPQAGQGLMNSSTAILPGGGTGVAAWTFKGLTPGIYQVSATWTPAANRATNASFTLVNGDRNTSVAVNQQAAPADFRDAGIAWQRLGQPFRITGNTLVVQLSDLANGTVNADAVRVERVGHNGTILTATDAGFKATGNWTSSRGANGRVNALGNSGSASWTFNVRPGQYRISATWIPASNLSAQAHYTITDGATELGSFTLNQRQNPNHFRDAGLRWQDLSPQGGLYPIQSGRLTVTLTPGAQVVGPIGNDFVSADSIRIEQFNGPTIQTQADVIRFLEQATWGPSPELAAAVESIGLVDYMAYQTSLPSSSYPLQPQYPQNTGTGCPTAPTNECIRNNYTMYIPQCYFFFNGMYAEDQLRQRLAWALHKIIVVGATEPDTRQPSRMVPYLEIINQHTLGSFRSLIQQITLNPAMGAYLDMLGSTRTRPNENYARELLQLFTIGLDMLNPDGTPILDGLGNRIPTYDQAMVEAYTRVLTGWNLQAQVPAPPPLTGNVPNYQLPMYIANNTQAQNNHDWTQKNLLGGVVIPARTQTAQQTVANANAELTTALDSVFAHPNVGPFICKSLIQQLVTSNPSPGYVARVTSWFDNDGTGFRGNLGTVIWAILFDPEARDLPVDPNYGKLREPVQLALNLLRAFNATSRDGTYYSEGFINPQTNTIGQNVFNPPSVFSYFMPDNVLPGTTNVLAPEFQILDTVMAIRRANFVNTMTFGGGINVSTAFPFDAFLGTALTLAPLEALAGDAGSMADYLNDLLLHGDMSAAMRSQIVTAVNAVPANNPTKRARTAIYLVVTSSQYQIQR